MLAKAHEGDLVLSDSVGGGANFQLILPIVETTSDTQELKEVAEIKDTDQQEEPKTEGANETRTFRVLLVEDNEELLQMTTDALRPYFRILKAHDGMEALDVLNYNDVDVIVSDVMMPRMDGIELCQRIKEDINYSHIPIILLTAKTSIEAKLEGMQSGADIYLEKPFSAKQLHLQIMNLLRMRQQFYERMRNINNAGDATTTEGELGMNQQDLQFMERLQQMVAENMRDEEFSIDILAEQMNMSRSSFYRKIKALTDMTPIEYLKMRRLEHAAQLLRQGVRITEVAERVGFTSSSYFAKCFKSRFGVLPKEYIQ
jgi:DNA-binding response OmpR family regulator